MKPKEFLSNIGATVTALEASKILHLSPLNTGKVLNRWMSQGWILRIARGIYAPCSLSSVEKNPADDKLVGVQAIIGEKGYLCGWSAAEYWGITEQIFRDISVASFKWKRPNQIKSPYGIYKTFKIQEQPKVGLSTVWCYDKKVFISDIHMTMLDMLLHPSWGGGILHVLDCLNDYTKYEEKNFDTMLDYARFLAVKKVFYKRLGYLLEKIGGYEFVVERCLANISKGYTKLDPSVSKGKLYTKWQLIVPENMKFGVTKDD